MKTTASNVKLRQLIQMVQAKTLVPRPDFQRRLIWSTLDKNNFIETVLKGYPFPEIYLANGDVDTTTGEGTQLLVDGQQRITTLFQYFSGPSWKLANNIPGYLSLEEDERKVFLDYDVAVRDLGNVSSEEIIEVFRRINATKYALNDIEINNAVYAGALKVFSERIAALPFFEDNGVFKNEDLKRMGDLRFALQLVVTLLVGYFNRDEEVERALASYNDEFAHSRDIEARIQRTVSFIEECDFSKKSRVWKKGDLFTLMVESDGCFQHGVRLDAGGAAARLFAFYEMVDHASEAVGSAAVAVYYKATIQANNDRLNRVRRGRIISSLLKNEDPELAAQEIG